MSEKRIIAGVDTSKLEGFREAQREDPVNLGLSAKAIWEGDMGRASVHIGPFKLNEDTVDRETRRYTIAYGAWKEVEDTIGFVGPTDRQEPVEMALGAMAACIVNAITFNVHRYDIELENLEVSVSTDVNPDVLFELKGPTEHNACMQNLRADIKAEGKDMTPEKLAIIKKLAEHSPVDGLVAQSNTVTHIVRS
jgi:uncharacterized OsmC-like protein